MNLTVHKNTLEKKKRKDLRLEIEYQARRLARDSAVSEKINGYGIVVWDDDKTAQAHCNGGDIPASLVGEYFKQTISRLLHINDIREDNR